MHILQVYTHSPESCPIGNRKNLLTMEDWLKKVEALTAKHGVMVVGIWTDRWGHKSWAVYEAPSTEAFEAFEQEPENLEKVKFNDVETRIVTVPSQTLAFFARLKQQTP
jgi:hypothetical protein